VVALRKPAAETLECSECPARITQNRRGRPRTTCSPRCKSARNRRMVHDRASDVASTVVEECECGNARTSAADACARCTALDASDSMAYRLVSALRVLGGVATLDALTEELGVGYHQVWLCARMLKERGRLRTLPILDGAEGAPKLRYVSAEGDDPRQAGNYTRRGYYVAVKSKGPDYGSAGLLYILTAPTEAT
jgi:hypothetical protein